MALTRRKFLGSSVLFASAAILPLGFARLSFAQKARGSVRVTDGSAAQIPYRAQQDPVFMFSRATFDPYVGGFFQAPNARGEMVTLKLVKVESYSPQRDTRLSLSKAVNTDSFTLLFSSQERLPRFSSIQQFSHPALGDFSLFVKEYDGVDGEIFYEAVINHTH